jgi:MoaF C-terminal domain/MoaF N-terminal domain
MAHHEAHGRQSFEAQGSAFLKQNIADKPEFDYAENRPPHSFELAGKTFTLALRDADVRYRHSFTRDEVAIAVLGPEAERRPIVTSYEAFEMAPGIFFVTYLVDDFDSVAMALDLVRGVATVVMGEMTEEGIISRVGASRVEEIAGEGMPAADGVSAGEGAPAYHQRHSLGGTRFLNTYAHNVAYEHIYLTGVYETWLGVRGPQAGQADTEEYHAFKIDDGVYFLYWNEGVLTAQMTFLFNFFSGKCVAELFARVERAVVHSTIGADTTLIHSNLPELSDVPRLDVYSGD